MIFDDPDTWSDEDYDLAEMSPEDWPAWALEPDYPPLLDHKPGCTRPAPVFGRSFFTFKPEMRCPECDATNTKHNTRETR